MKGRQLWGTCNNDSCAINVTIEPHPESPLRVLDTAFLDDPTCPSCAEPFTFDGSENHASWEVPA